MNLDKNNIKPEHIEQAFQMLEEYCLDKKVNVLDFVKNQNNIPLAAEEIHKKLPFAIKLFFKPNKISQLLIDNHDFIIEKAKEQIKKRKIK